MAITLDPTLKAAQDGMNHRPIIKLTSSPMESTLPYRGNKFNTGSYIEENRDLIVAASGRLCNLYVRGGALHYYYTDIDRTAWQAPVLIYDSKTVHSASICELAGGNLGIILITAGHDLKYMIISETGGIETSATDILAGADWLGSPSVITLANNTYLLVYSGGTGEPPDQTNSYYFYIKTSSNFISWN